MRARRSALFLSGCATVLVGASVCVTAAAAQPSGATDSGATTPVAGDQRTVVIMGNFRDRPLECSAQAVRDIVFTDPNDRALDDLFRAASDGQVSLSGQAIGPFDLPAGSNDPCDPEAWANALDAKALAANVDPNTYARKVYVLPLAFQCPGTGTGSMLGTPTRAWVFRCDMPDVYAHEIGHTFGLGHASTPTGEYADNSDFMGSGGVGLRQLNAPHYEDLGWRSGTAIRTVTASGRYEVAPLALGAAQAIAPQILKIAKPDTGEWYYVSFRRAQGFDSKLYSTYAEKVSVHRDQSGTNRSYLLATLGDGANFADAATGLSVTLVSRTPDYATVEVTVPGGSTACTRSAPGVTVSPASQSGTAGQSLGYSLAVRNTDTAGCPASTFALTASGLPSGWQGSSSPGSLSLAPGATGTVTLTITSPLTAAAGSYAIGALANDAAVPVHSASSTAVYDVVSACTRQNPTVSVAPSMQSGTPGSTLQFAATLTNRDSSGCSGTTFGVGRKVPTGWASSLTSTSVSLAPGQSTQVSLAVTSPSLATSGSYAVEVQLTDTQAAARTATGPATYSVTVSADTQAPSAPTGLAASVDAKRKRATLSWNSATDNVGIAKYRVWRDGVVLGESTGTWYLDGSLVAGVTYSYYVTALDAAGNQSTPSGTVQATIAVRSTSKR